MKTYYGFGLLVVVIGLSGCASNQLYEWGGYREQLYDHLQLKTKTPELALSEMELELTKMNSKKSKPPPGYYAHMALLATKSGNPELAKKYLNSEKASFPEGTSFIDFVLKGI